MAKLEQIVKLIQWEIKAAALRGDVKYLRYLNTALHNLKLYLEKQKKG